MNWFKHIRSSFTPALVALIIFINWHQPSMIMRYLGGALLGSIIYSLFNLATMWCEEKGLTYGDLVKWLRRGRTEKLTAGKG